jgi:hypothetical protein
MNKGAPEGKANGNETSMAVHKRNKEGKGIRGRLRAGRGRKERPGSLTPIPTSRALR